MSTEGDILRNFLAALDAVKEDYTCNHCSEMLKDPVVLSECFHLVCSSHFDELTHCPTCKKPLSNCTTYRDERLQKSVDSAAALSKIFEQLRGCDSQKQIEDEGEKKRSKTQSDTNTPPKVWE